MRQAHGRNRIFSGFLDHKRNAEFKNRGSPAVYDADSAAAAGSIHPAESFDFRQAAAEIILSAVVGTDRQPRRNADLNGIRRDEQFHLIRRIRQRSDCKDT